MVSHPTTPRPPLIAPPSESGTPKHIACPMTSTGIWLYCRFSPPTTTYSGDGFSPTREPRRVDQEQLGSARSSKSSAPKGRLPEPPSSRTEFSNEKEQTIPSIPGRNTQPGSLSPDAEHKLAAPPARTEYSIRDVFSELGLISGTCSFVPTPPGVHFVCALPAMILFPWPIRGFTIRTTHSRARPTPFLLLAVSAWSAQRSHYSRVWEGIAACRAR